MVGTEYIPRKFQPWKRTRIRQANAIVEEYAAQGFKLTLRQIYYQFVARGLLGNSKDNYTVLGRDLSDARYAGVMAMDAIEDRGRWTRTNDHDSGDVDEWLSEVAWSYQRSRWAGQAEMVEVWLEKEALTSIIAPTCERLRVPYFPLIGYTSTSEIAVAVNRIEDYLDNDQTVTILHLGDHDAWGLDMTRHIRDRVTLMLEADGYDAGNLTVKRIALNIDQVEEHQPPPNFAKEGRAGSDDLAQRYIEEFGDESWELDALEPSVIIDLIRTEVEKRINVQPHDEDEDEEPYADLDDDDEEELEEGERNAAWQQLEQEEDAARAELENVGACWGSVTKWLADNPTIRAHSDRMNAWKDAADMRLIGDDKPSAVALLASLLRDHPGCGCAECERSEPEPG